MDFPVQIEGGVEEKLNNPFLERYLLPKKQSIPQNWRVVSQTIVPAPTKSSNIRQQQNKSQIMLGRPQGIASWICPIGDTVVGCELEHIIVQLKLFDNVQETMIESNDKMGSLSWFWWSPSSPWWIPSNPLVIT